MALISQKINVSGVLKKLRSSRDLSACGRFFVENSRDIFSIPGVPEPISFSCFLVRKQLKLAPWRR